jgi:hypothetical protein
MAHRYNLLQVISVEDGAQGLVDPMLECGPKGGTLIQSPDFAKNWVNRIVRQQKEMIGRQANLSPAAWGRS